MTFESAHLFDILLTIIGVLLTGMAGMFLKEFGDLSGEFKELRKSVECLNATIGAVIEKINHHEVRISRLEDNPK